ncbi:glycosyltransferase family 2 protein [Desulfovibrio litoralis]|uniref:Alpha-1,3-rhamnosyltransferase n=1 Tax=Desulfovibrio litoralis DSM 11393 TaxID=1121455 RepID=A0A1M7T7D1_9BACT|nr:glycosyltransferase family 2 protein [Desulfovibrio litoralis]SHN66640.1 alpha-1,3-rhamnosyltransferase [Desulfovibrio litoralis DSM 11393]
MIVNSNDQPLCSVCCLSYNHSKFIKQNITSIWEQSYKNIEIIALDDGSPDNSAKILTDLKEQSPFPMKVLLQKNTGSVSKNFNRLLDNASGKYILFISCDDMLTEETIQSKIDLMEQNDNIVFVASKRNYNIDDDGNVFDKNVFTYLDDSIKTAEDLLSCEHENIGSFYIQNALFRKSIVNAVGGFDEDLLGDDIVLRTKCFLYMKQHPELTFRITDDFGMYYRSHDNNIHKNSERQIKLIAQVFERYFSDKKAPKKFVKMMKDRVSNVLFEDALRSLFISKKCIELLEDKEMQEHIIKKHAQESREQIFSLYKVKSKEYKYVYLVVFRRRFLLYKKRRKLA